MRGVKLAIVLALVGPAASARAVEPAFPEWPSLLQTEVVRVTRSYDGEAMLFVKDVKTGVRYTYNASTPAYLASGVKLAFMTGLFKEMALGRLTLDEPIRYDQPDVRDGAPVFDEIKVGSTVPLRMALEAMIHQSDNAASDLVAKRVGIDRINQTLKDEGLSGFGPLTTLLDVRRLAYSYMSPRVTALSASEIRSIGIARTLETRVERLLELVGEPSGSLSGADWDRAFREYYRLGYNTASMESTALLLERLATRTLVNPEASRQMLELMLGTQTGSQRIVAKIPAAVDVAHKTGTQYLRICDLGIIYVEPEHPVIFAACTKGGARARAEEVIAVVARKTYELLAPEVLMDVGESMTSTMAETEGGAELRPDLKPHGPKKTRPPKRRGHP